MRKLLLLLICTYATNARLPAQTLQVHPMLNSIGLEIDLPAGFDADQSSHCIIRFKPPGYLYWLDGLDAERISLDGADQFRGSLFNLTEGGAYEVEVTLLDSFPTISSLTLAAQNITTLSANPISAGAIIKWVSPGGSGNAYTQNNPGNLKTLLNSGGVSCGVTVMLMDGLYTDLNLALQLTADCTENSPIQFIAAPGAHPVFDGGYATPLTWTQHPNDPKLFSAALPTGSDYTNLCLLNGQMLYPYPTLTANPLFHNYNLSDQNLDCDGFVRDNSVIWIKTAAGTRPDTSTVVVSKTFRFLTVYGNDHQAYLRFKGLTVRNIAKSNVSGATAYTAIAFDIRNAHQLRFDSCNLAYNNAHITFTGACNDILVQHCRFEQQNGLWSHAMTKKSLENTVFVSSSLGRAGETGAIELVESKHLSVRYNHFLGTNSGVVSRFDTGLMEEADIYGNTFTDNFDAIECDGNWCNLRVWQNEIIRPMAGFSIAPPLIGPRYFYRNLVHHMRGRHNVENDPYYSGCTPPADFRSAGIGIKTNSGAVSAHESAIYFINNTFYSEDSLGFTFTLWDSEWKRLHFINNICYDAHKQIGYFHSLADRPWFQFDAVHCDFYSANLNAPLLVAKEINGQFVCHDIFHVSDFENSLSAISGSSHIRFQDCFEADPYFTNTDNGGFELEVGSPFIDQGILVKGFYDYENSGPDLGAKERFVIVPTQQAPAPERVRLFPNPAENAVSLDAGQVCHSLDISVYNSAGQLMQQRRFADIQHVSLALNYPSGLYFLRIILDDNTVCSKQLVLERR